MNMSSSMRRFSTPSRTASPSIPNFLLDTVQALLIKLIELVQQLSCTQIPKQKDMSSSKPQSFINIYERKQITVKKQQPDNILNLKVEFEKIQAKLHNFKSSPGFDKTVLESSPSPFNEPEELELKIMKVEDEFRGEFAALKERLKGVEEDMGHILLLYKDIICDR